METIFISSFCTGVLKETKILNHREFYQILNKEFEVFLKSMLVLRWLKKTNHVNVTYIKPSRELRHLSLLLKEFCDFCHRPLGV
jgi:hypothetical protein